MNTFDDFVAGAKEAAQQIGNKAGKIYDVSKLKLSAADVNNEISRRFEALGKALYRSRKDGTDIEQLLAENISGIDSAYERLERINQKIAEMKERSICPGCGVFVDKGDDFCPKCGAKMS